MIKDIAKIDKNFAAPSASHPMDAVFYDVKENPFCLFGVFYRDCECQKSSHK